MAATTIEKRALNLLKAFEQAGKLVNRVSVEGRKIEIVLAAPKLEDEFERIDMRHGKT